MRYFSASVLSVLALAACDDTHDHEHGDEATALFEEAYAQTELGKTDTGGCSGVVVPDKSGFGKRVALTFDDGPNPLTTPTVLDILKEHGIQATFFINGTRVRGEAERAILARIVAEGHQLANHSQSHLDLKTVSTSKLESEVKKTHDEIIAAEGQAKYFRFPFGSASCAGMKFVEDMGYIVTGWHIDTADWCFAKSSDGTCKQSTFRYVPDQYRGSLEGYTMSQVRAKDGGILLFHDIHPNTVKVLPGIIETLEDEGYVFVNVDNTTYFPRLHGLTPPPAKFVGDECATSDECNFSGKTSAASCHRYSVGEDDAIEAGFCTIPCEGSCPDREGKAPTFCTSLDDGATGRCVAKSHEVNQECAAILGTNVVTVDRFIGESTSSAATADVCLPE